MKEELIIRGANAITMFCRQNSNAKRDLPLRSSEIGLLIYVVKTEAPVTPAMAADFFRVSKPMIAAMVRSLTTKGYLAKRPSQTDKRSYALAPTGKAVALTDSVYEEYFKVMRRLLAGMGKEKYESMVILLEKANTILIEGDTVWAK